MRFNIAIFLMLITATLQAQVVPNATNADQLGGQPATSYLSISGGSETYATKTEVNASTNALQAQATINRTDINAVFVATDTERTARINADALLATKAEVNTSSNALQAQSTINRTDINAIFAATDTERTARINSDNAMQASKADRAEVQLATATLQSTKMDKSGGTFTGPIIITSFVAQVGVVEDLYFTSASVSAIKSTAIQTDYLGSTTNYSYITMTSNVNLNGYKFYGGNIADVGIQTSTQASHDQEILLGQCTGQAKVLADATYSTRTSTDSCLPLHGIADKAAELYTPSIYVRERGASEGWSGNDGIIHFYKTGTSLHAPIKASTATFDLVNDRPVSDFASVNSTNSLGIEKANRTEVQDSTNSIQAQIDAVQYSSFTFIFVFTSSDVTTASVIGWTEFASFSTDIQIYAWVVETNVAGASFTMTTSTAAYANTPSYGNSIFQTSPNIVGTIASSGTISVPYQTIPAGYFMHGVCNSATVGDIFRVTYYARKRGKVL